VRKDVKKILNENIQWIQFNLKHHTIFWIGNQLGIDKATMHRYAKMYGWKGRDMKEALSIEWTEKMLDTLKEKFSTTFNIVLAKEIGVSQRTLIRKARELKLEKEPDFLKKRRDIIGAMAHASRGRNDQATIDRITQAGIPYRFKKGNVPPKVLPPEIKEVQHLIKSLNRKINRHEKHNHRPS